MPLWLVLAMAAVVVVAAGVSLRRGFKQSRGTGYRALFMTLALTALVGAVLRKNELLDLPIMMYLIYFGFAPVATLVMVAAVYKLEWRPVPWSPAHEAWFAGRCRLWVGPTAIMFAVSLCFRSSWVEAAVTIAGAAIAWWPLSKWCNSFGQDTPA